MIRATRQLPAVDAVSDTASVAWVRDSWGFTTLRHEWRDLLQASDSHNPFLTWEWLSAWWTHFGSADGLRVLLVRADQKLIAAAPFRLVASPLSWLSHLEFLGTGEAGSDYLDVIVRRGCEGEALTAIADHLAEQNCALRLTHLPPASTSVQVAQRLAAAGWSVSFAADGMCPIVDLAGQTFDSFLDTLGASHRANIRRRLRALERRFDVRFQPVVQHADRRVMLDALAAFHERRYRSRGGSTAFSSDAARAFHDDATRRALDRGWLRMYALRLDGRIAAVMYGFSCAGSFYFYQHGYDEAYASHSTGLVLMALTIRAAIDEGAREFDLLWGTESYKSLWARSERPLERVELFPPDFAGIVQRRCVDAHRTVRQLARRLLAARRPPGASHVG